MLGRAAVVDEAVADTRDRGRKEDAAPVDVLAEPSDPLPAVQRLERAVLDVGDEQPRGVRPEVDRCDARHFEGKNERAEATAERTSVTAPISTRARASE